MALVRCGWGIALIAGVWCCWIGAQAAEVELVLLSPPRLVRPGELAVHALRCAHRGDASLQVQLDVEVPPGWSLVAGAETLSLGPGQEEVVFLVVVVPYSAPAGTYSLVVQARWNGQATQAEARVQVEPVLGLSLVVPSPQGVTPGRTTAFEVQVVNQGNVVERVVVDCSVPEGWGCEVRPTELMLGPQEWGGVQGELVVRAGVRPGRRVVRFRARSDSGAEASGAWFVDVLPPTPEAVVGTALADVEMKFAGRLAYDVLQGRAGSSLTLQGVGLVLDGRIEFDSQWAGPWDPQPYRPLRVSFLYDSPGVRAEMGNVSAQLAPLLLGVSAQGFSAELRLPQAKLFLLSGWHEGEARFGARALGLADLAQLSWEGGLAYWDVRRAVRTVAISGWLGLILAHGLKVELEGGLSSQAGLVARAARVAVGLAEWLSPLPQSSLRLELYGADRGFPGPYADRGGFLLSGALRAEPWAVRFSVRWERDNLPPVLFLTTLAHSEITAAVDWAPEGRWLAAFARLGIERVQEMAAAPNVDARVRTVELGARLGELPLEITLRGRWRWEEDLLVPSEQALQVYSQQLRWVWGDVRLTLALEQEVRPAWGTATPRAQLGVQIPGGLDLTWSWGPVDSRLTFSVGLRPLAERWSVSASLSGRWDREGKATALELGAGFEVEFGFNPPFLPVKGWLQGRVFVDGNGNGRWDAGEEGVAGAVLKANSERVATGSDGAFLFPPFPPGTYELTVESLPPGLKALLEFPISAVVVLAGRTEVHIPCLPLAEVTGVVFDDLNRNGLWDSGEPGLRRLRVVLFRAGQLVDEAFSDPTGKFAFVDLEPGSYEVRLDPAFVPEGYEPTTPQAAAVELAPGGKVEARFGLWRRPRLVVVFQLPVAEFVWRPEQPRAGEPVEFDGTPSYDPDGAIVDWAWDFTGDGVPDARGPQPRWTFDAAGLYLVTLTVTDNDGFQHRLSLAVEVVP